MPTLTVTNLAGEAKEIDGVAGQSLMEAIRDNGVDDLQALCGGCCSCATCHVWVETAFLPSLPAMSAQENDMLGCSSYRKANSRLSCQLPFSNELDGIRVTLAPVG